MPAPTTKVPPALLSHAMIIVGGKHSLRLKQVMGEPLWTFPLQDEGSNSWAAASETTLRKSRGRAARPKEVSNAFVSPADSR